MTVAARQPRQPCSKVQTVSIRSSKMGCDPLDLEGGKGSWPKLREGQRETQRLRDKTPTVSLCGALPRTAAAPVGS